MKKNPFAKSNPKADDFLNNELVGEPQKTGSLIRKVWRNRTTGEHCETYEQNNEDV